MIAQNRAAVIVVGPLGFEPGTSGDVSHNSSFFHFGFSKYVKSLFSHP